MADPTKTESDGLDSQGIVNAIVLAGALSKTRGGDGLGGVRTRELVVDIQEVEEVMGELGVGIGTMGGGEGGAGVQAGQEQGEHRQKGRDDQQGGRGGPGHGGQVGGRESGRGGQGGWGGRGGGGHGGITHEFSG